MHTYTFTEESTIRQQDIYMQLRNHYEIVITITSYDMECIIMSLLKLMRS